MKLAQDDATRICQRIIDHGMDTGLVAEQFEISRRRVQQLAKAYRESGKIEQFFQTYEKHHQRFGTLDEFLTFYNEERPHMRLNWDNLETPAEAFERLVPSPAKSGGDLLATEVTVDG